MSQEKSSKKVGLLLIEQLALRFEIKSAAYVIGVDLNIDIISKNIDPGP